jgi:hypothetical protein
VLAAAPAVSPPAPAAPASPASPARAPVLELSVDVDDGVDDRQEPPDEVTQAEPAAAVADALSSQERLVAVEPTTEARSFEQPEPVSASPEPVQGMEPTADEEIEQPPASSRRPLAPQPEERLAEMAFGADDPRPALHTPPPESGRLPAAPAVEFPDEDTGVHPAAPPASAVIQSEATRADLAGAAGAEKVAALKGAVRVFHPTSFAELLDASLGL